MVKNLPASTGDAREAGSISGLGRSSGVGSGNLFQYSCLEISMARGRTVHGATEHTHMIKSHLDFIRFYCYMFPLLLYCF